MSALPETIEHLEGWEPGFRRLSPDEWERHPAGGWYVGMPRYAPGTGGMSSVHYGRTGAEEPDDVKTARALKRSQWKPLTGHETWCYSQSPPCWRSKSRSGPFQSVNQTCTCSRNELAGHLRKFRAARVDDGWVVSSPTIVGGSNNGA